MNSKTTIPLSILRKNLFSIAEDVTKSGKRYTLTQKGVPTLVLMPIDEFESWRETLEVMREMPNLAKEIMEARKDYKKGNTVGLEDILREHGFHKLAEQYEQNLSNRVTSKSKKRIK